jgi:hypothetical protein
MQRSRIAAIKPRRKEGWLEKQTGHGERIEMTFDERRKRIEQEGALSQSGYEQPPREKRCRR